MVEVLDRTDQVPHLVFFRFLFLGFLERSRPVVGLEFGDEVHVG